MTRSNWSYMLLAFVMSVSLWYMVVGQARVEQPITLRIEYSGMPSDLVIKNGLVQDITIQLRGPRALIRTASDSRYTYTVDLSHIKKGMNTVPLTTKDLPFTRAFEVVDMKPSRLNLEVDALVEREIGIDVHMREGTPTGVVVENFTWKPQSVTVRGPESVVANIFRLHAEVPPPTQSSNRRITTQASIVVPALVEAIPVQVDVSYNANIAMREMVLTRTLNHAVNLEHFSVSPHEVSIRVSIPELEAEDEALLRSITAYFEVPDEAPYMASHSVTSTGQRQLATDIDSTKMLSMVSAEGSPTDVSNLHATLSPVTGDLAPTMPTMESDELPILAELPESAREPIFTPDVDEALTNALRDSAHSSKDSAHTSSGPAELVLTTVPVRISAPPLVKILEITPPEIELMLR